MMHAVSPEMLNQYEQHPLAEKRFFKALSEGRFTNALEIVSAHHLDINHAGGIIRAPALYYVISCSQQLDPSILQAFLDNGADPHLTKTDILKNCTVLETLIKTGFFYYTRFMMSADQKLEQNFFKCITLLSSHGVTLREELFEAIQVQGDLFYSATRDYTKFRKNISEAIAEGQGIFEGFQKEIQMRKLNPTL